MLEQLSIQNFAITREIEWELHQGFHVITGETGAGKSILFDALLLCLGGRGDAKLVRPDCDKATIAANFSVKAIPAAKAWLQEHELDSEDECVITRMLHKDGRSRQTINGVACPQQLVRDLSQILLNVCGQHEHQRLVKREHQRGFLDTFAVHPEKLNAMKTLFVQWQTVNEELSEIREQQNNQARLALLQFQVTELAELQLQPNEYDDLSQQQHRLANAESLMQTCHASLGLLRDDDVTALGLINQCETSLAVFSEEATLANAAGLLNHAGILIEEASDEIRHFLDKVNLDPKSLQQVEDRLAKLHDIARKHHIKPAQLPELFENLQSEFDNLTYANERITALEKELAEIAKRYTLAAKAVFDSREKAAKKLSEKVTQIIRTLGMPHGQFEVRCTWQANATPSESGLDSIEFYITANPGVPAQPIAKTASGGELSRLCLAIQVCNAKAVDTPTLLFDEVDVGIGGSTAQIVGQLLRELGEQVQIICVTHQPQVVALAHHHYQVSKHSTKNSTETSLQLLEGEARVKELARMLGGIEITANTLAHAKEMLENH